MAVAALLAALIAVPALRTRGDYFVLATFGLQVIATSLMTNLEGVTGGPMGLPGIPQPTVFGTTLAALWQMLLLVWALAVVTFWCLCRLVQAPYGRALRAVRADEVFAQAMGKPVLLLKVKAFALAAAIAAAAGGLYAVYITFIDPSSFTVMESIFMLAIVIIGGAGSIRGSALGALVLVGLPEALGFVCLPAGPAANIRQMLYGALLVAAMMWRPQGLLGECTFQQRRT